MNLSFIIPNVTKSTEKLNMLKTCIDTFRKFNGNEHELIVVDDGSDIAYQVQIKSMCDDYGAMFIAKPFNEGFSTTVNVGIRASKGDAVVICNNDLSFTESIHKQIVDDFNSDDKIGVIGALLLYPNGTIQHGGIVRHGYGFSHIGWHKIPASAPEVSTKKYLVGVTGALFAIRRKCFEDIGLFDETYFLACEDTQYCLRTWQGEWRVFYDPSITAIHVEGGTRGNTTQSKLTNSIDTRNWYIKELQTNDKFLKLIKTIDFSEIERRINLAGMDLINKNITNIQQSIKSVVHETIHSSSDVQIKRVSFSDEPRKGKFTSSGKTIGIHRAGAMGDVLLATPVVRELKRLYPESQIIFSTQSQEAVARNANIDHVVGSIEELRKYTNVIYDLDLAYEKSPKKHVTQAYANVVFGNDIQDLRMDLDSSENDYESAMKYFSGINFERDKIICIHMSVSWENRTWPKTYWSSLIKMITTRGYKVIVLGRGGDYRSDLMAGVHNLVDHLNIYQVREVIKKSHCFVSTDSGLMHIAQTTSTPVVGMFTVAKPEYRITRAENTTSLIPSVECRFCLHEEIPPVTFVGCKTRTLQCLKDITPDQVFSSVLKHI